MERRQKFGDGLKHKGNHGGGLETCIIDSEFFYVW